MKQRMAQRRAAGRRERDVKKGWEASQKLEEQREKRVRTKLFHVIEAPPVHKTAFMLGEGRGLPF
jgi:hypothetical protein